MLKVLVLLEGVLVLPVEVLDVGELGNPCA